MLSTAEFAEMLLVEQYAKQVQQLGREFKDLSKQKSK